jgi:hypothetical protein
MGGLMAEALFAILVVVVVSVVALRLMMGVVRLW